MEKIMSSLKVHSLLAVILMVMHGYSMYANGDTPNSFNCLAEVISVFSTASCPVIWDTSYGTSCDGHKRVCSVSPRNDLIDRHPYTYSDLLLTLMLNKDVNLTVSRQTGRLCTYPTYVVVCDISQQTLETIHQEYLSTEKNALEGTTSFERNNQQKECKDREYLYGISFVGGIIFGGSLTIMIFLAAKRLQSKCITEKKRAEQSVDHEYRYETTNETPSRPSTGTASPDENGRVSENARGVNGSRVEPIVPFIDVSESQSVDYNVYNHLHEKRADNMDDDYDHVEPHSQALDQTAQHEIPEEIFTDCAEYSEICKSSLSIAEEANNDPTIKTINDDYFVLEEVKQ